jgi:hypothetical protein
MTRPLDLTIPWTLHFDRDGTEDVAVICDPHGEDLVTSLHFWLPEEMIRSRGRWLPCN